MEWLKIYFRSADEYQQKQTHKHVLALEAATVAVFRLQIGWLFWDFGVIYRRITMYFTADFLILPRLDRVIVPLWCHYPIYLEFLMSHHWSYCSETLRHAEGGHVLLRGGGKSLAMGLEVSGPWGGMVLESLWPWDSRWVDLREGGVTRESMAMDSRWVDPRGRGGRVIRESMAMGLEVSRPWGRGHGSLWSWDSRWVDPREGGGVTRESLAMGLEVSDHPGKGREGVNTTVSGHGTRGEWINPGN